MKEALSAAAILLTFFAFMPCVVSILRGHAKPHVFSWVIWGTTTLVVFLAQLEGKGGSGAWPIGVSGAIALFIAFLAYRRQADSAIAPLDWLFFAPAMSALPFWYLTGDPFWAVLILTSADLLGFGPTIRKAYHFPFEDQMTFYLLFVLRNGLAITAFAHYSPTTVLFPAATAIACSVLVSMVAYRRVTLAPS